MARIRTVKPEFHTDEDIASLPFHVRLFYIGLWNHADREGRLEDRPKYLKSQIFPYDDINIDECLSTLSQNKVTYPEPFILRYESEGRKYIQIIKFRDHQKPHMTERDSVIPPSDSGYLTVKKPLSKQKIKLGREGLRVMEKGKDNGGASPGKPGLTDLEYIDQVKADFNAMMEDSSQTSQWRDFYGQHLDIDRMLYAACTWLVERPRNRKVKLRQFYGNWLRNNFQQAQLKSANP